MKLVSQELPPQNVIVRTISESGQEQELYRIGKLWFLPDGGMYVYCTPRFWDYMERDAERNRR